MLEIILQDLIIYYFDIMHDHIIRTETIIAFLDIWHDIMLPELKILWSDAKHDIFIIQITEHLYELMLDDQPLDQIIFEYDLIDLQI